MTSAITKKATPRLPAKITPLLLNRKKMTVVKASIAKGGRMLCKNPLSASSIFPVPAFETLNLALKLC